MRKSDSVQMLESYARWHLENPCLYNFLKDGNPSKKSDTEIQVHLLCCLGEPVYGLVVQRGDGPLPYYKVKFTIDRLSITRWVLESDIRTVR